MTEKKNMLTNNSRESLLDIGWEVCQSSALSRDTTAQSGDC